jgi:hypothetical protein
LEKYTAFLLQYSKSGNKSHLTISVLNPHFSNTMCFSEVQSEIEQKSGAHTYGQ